MYSKEESLQLKKDFWTAFAAAYPKKWLLYNTKIKDVTFKFYVDTKMAMVLLDIAPKDIEKKRIYFEKIVSLKSILVEEFLPDALFEEFFTLETGKEIGRIWVEKKGISLNNKAHWPEIFDFFNEKMTAFEYFFYEYQDYISDLELNT